MKICVEYSGIGAEGETCADCVYFQMNEEDEKRGLCHGHEIYSNGNCNFFSKKDCAEKDNRAEC